MVAYAAFYEESRMKFADPTKPYRKSGGTRLPEIRWEWTRQGDSCKPHVRHETGSKRERMKPLRSLRRP